jgi:hypothetical protein
MWCQIRLEKDSPFAKAIMEGVRRKKMETIKEIKSEDKCKDCKWEVDRFVNYEPGKHPCDDCVRETKLVDKYEKIKEKPKLPEKLSGHSIINAGNNEAESWYLTTDLTVNQIIDYLKAREEQVNGLS